MLFRSGRPPLEPAAQPRGRFRFASPGYFPAIGLRLAKGRFFEETDSADSQPVALINEAAAKQYFAGQDPIGQRIKTGFDDSVYCTIVGVVGNTQFLGLDSNPGPETFYHYQQLPPSMVTFLAGTSTMVLRTSGDPASLAGAARAAVAAIDPELAVFDLRTMTDAIDKSVSQPRFRLTLMIVFGALAILLASLGLYGLLAFSVGQRTNEIGVRMALGADRSKILGMVVGEGLALALAGALIGIALSFWLAQFLEKFLYGVKARDLATFALAPLLILAVSLVASLWPARNATRVDPLDALRSE